MAKTLSINVANYLRTADRVLKSKERFDMGSFCIATEEETGYRSCGTAACIAGHAYFLKNKKGMPVDENKAGRLSHVISRGQDEIAEWLGIENAKDHAESLLSHRVDLFFLDNWPVKWVMAYEFVIAPMKSRVAYGCMLDLLVTGWDGRYKIKPVFS
jgi:hypothetical protein